MPTREWSLRIEDILGAIARIQRLTEKMTFEQFEADEAISSAVLYNFIIIGEAAINIPSAMQDSYPEIPWRLMGDMRNVMAHEYFRVNLRRVWNTLQNYLPLVAAQLQDLLEREGRE